jgi:hypothetical protein
VWVFLASGDPQVDTWINYIQSGGIIGVLVVLTVALLTRRIVPGWTYDAMERDRDYYRDVAHKGVELADRQVKVAEVLADRAGLLETRAAVLTRREREDEIYSKEQREADRGR